MDIHQNKNSDMRQINTTMKPYKFVFWGNIGIHVYPLAEALSKKAQVTIICDSSTFSDRKERTITYKPSDTLRLIDIANADICRLKSIIKEYNDNKTIHINSALKNEKSIFHKALKMLTSLNQHGYLISLPQEGFQFQGIKWLVNRIKWFYYINMRYRKIQYFGYTGMNAFRDLTSIGCSKKRLFPFIYVTQPYHSVDVYKGPTQKLRKYVKMIFVGAIDDRKNIGTIIQWLNEDTDSLCAPFELDIYGGYGDENLLYRLINGNRSIHYHGIVSNEEVRAAMLESDIAILPSKYDGWGAVVNEALQCGCQVLVSNCCGSSSMPKSFPKLGKAFDPYNKKDFILKLNELLRQGILSEKARMEIIKWSEQHIHPNIAAQYLIDVIDAVENKKPLPPNIFW